MSRRFTALKPQLNRIRAWAQEGSTDAWIAHQLDTTAEAVRAFRQEQGIERGGPAPLAPITPDSVVEAMLAEEEAAAAARPAEVVAAPATEPDTEPAPESADDSPPARAPRRRTRKRAAEPVADAGADTPAAEAVPAAEETAAGAPAKRSRRATRGGSARTGSTTAGATEEPAAADSAGRADDEDQSPAGATRKRGGRRRGRGRGAARPLEARLLPGSVLLLDPAVTADPAFQEHWGDASALRVEIGPDAIVLRRAAPDGAAERQPAS